MELTRRVGYSVIRPLEDSDLEELVRIHEKFYKSEFSLASFLDNLRNALVVGDDEGIITIGGIKPILEISAVTNKDRTAWLRREALIFMNEMFRSKAKELGYHEMYAFVQDPTWLKIIQRYGYRLAKGVPVLTEI